MNSIPGLYGTPYSTGTYRLNYYFDYDTTIFYAGTTAPPITVGSFVTGASIAANTTVVAIGTYDSIENGYFVTLSIGSLTTASYTETLSFYNASNSIRYADFVRLTTQNKITAPFTVGQEYTILSVGTTDWTAIGAASNTAGVTFTATGIGSGTGVATKQAIYLFSTAPSAITVTAVDANPFDGLGQLVQIGSATRDVKSTANETTFTLIGIDTSMLSLVLGTDIKGSKIEAWHGFFDASGSLLTNGGTGGLYKYFTGYINSFAISEQWMEEMRSYIGAVTVSASAIQIILRNRLAGRYTNDASWQFFNPLDKSMARVAFISTINYYFGKNT